MFLRRIWESRLRQARYPKLHRLQCALSIKSRKHCCRMSSTLFQSQATHVRWQARHNMIWEKLNSKIRSNRDLIHGSLLPSLSSNSSCFTFARARSLSIYPTPFNDTSSLEGPPSSTVASPNPHVFSCSQCLDRRRGQTPFSRALIDVMCCWGRRRPQGSKQNFCTGVQQHVQVGQNSPDRWCPTCCCRLGPSTLGHRFVAVC